MLSKFNSFSFLSIKGIKVYLLLLPFIIIAGAFLAYHKDPMIFIHPTNKRKQANLITFDDSHQHGKSNIVILKNYPNQLSYKYTISNAFLNPYAGVDLTPEEGKFFDLSAYDYIKLKIKASKGKRIMFGIGTYFEMDDPKKSSFVYVEKGITHAFRNTATTLETDNQYKEIIVPIKQLVTPDWWYIESKVDAKGVASPDYSKVKYVYFGNCIEIKPGIEDVVELEEIGFYKNYSTFYTSSLAGLSLYLVIAGLLFYKRKNEIDINFKHGKFTSDIPLTNEEEIVFGIITSQYMNQELSIADIQKSSGYSENRIAEIIKNKTGMNFKAFLNKLRMAETKRLLLETDFNISEIAEKVGYGNVTHFNRVFKTSEGSSPNEFRKRQKNYSHTIEEKA